MRKLERAFRAFVVGSPSGGRDWAALFNSAYKWGGYATVALLVAVILVFRQDIVAASGIGSVVVASIAPEDWEEFKANLRRAWRKSLRALSGAFSSKFVELLLTCVYLILVAWLRSVMPDSTALMA